MDLSHIWANEFQKSKWNNTMKIVIESRISTNQLRCIKRSWVSTLHVDQQHFIGDNTSTVSWTGWRFVPGSHKNLIYAYSVWRIYTALKLYTMKDFRWFISKYFFSMNIHSGLKVHDFFKYLNLLYYAPHFRKFLLLTFFKNIFWKQNNVSERLVS